MINMVKKKSWGPSNPLWRYLHNKKKKRSSNSSPVKRTRKKLVTSMARYRHKSRRHKSGGLMSMIKPLAIGAIAGKFVNPMLPQVVPMQNLAVGAGASYLIGGKNMKSMALGALGAFGINYLLGGSTSSSGSGIYLN